MSEAYIIAAAQGSIVPFSTRAYAEQVQPVLQEVLEKCGVPARKVQELHWFGGTEEFWLSALAQQMEFAPDLARFLWPAVPILSHAVLHSTSRAIEAGERDLIILGQQSGNQVIALVLASPRAVGRYNLAPRARVALRLALSRQPVGFLKAAQAAVETSELENKEVQRFVSPARFTADEVHAAFPIAHLAQVGAEQPSSDLFLLDALVRSLEESDASLGLLLSPAPHDAALATLIERT